jgi:diguanylate cyclase (GGDEF)-like protein/PAS domain S-box-containing protein
MLFPPVFADEDSRLQALDALRISFTERSAELDRITRVAARLFDVPIVLVTLLDAQRQWFKACHGLTLSHTRRDISFCGHAIHQKSPLIVPDAALDPRFADNPLVTGAPHIRFYAGQPIRSRRGYAFGTLCLIDRKPRQFSAADIDSLRDMAIMVEQYFHGIEAEHEAGAARHSLSRSEALFEQTVRQAAVGIALLAPDGRWLEVNQRTCDILGHEKATLLCGTFQAMTHPDDLPENLRLFGQVQNGEIDSYSLEKRFIRADGHISWVHVAVSVLRSDDALPVHYITVITDINERKRIERELSELRRDLEYRVARRTQELTETMQVLNTEMNQRRQMQLALLKEKERFQSTLENATDAFIEIDEHGCAVTWNRSAERIFGWSRDEMIGKPVIGTVMPAHLQSIYQSEFADFVKTGVAAMVGRRVEIAGIRKNGEIFPAELTFGINRSAGHLLVNAFLHDISQRKKAEQEIRESQSKLKMITDNVPVMISYVGPDLRYRFYNRTYEDWFNLPADGLEGKHISEFCGEEVFERIRPAIEIALSGEKISLDYQLRARDGDLWLHATFVPNIDANNTVQGLYVLSQDISERKRIQQRLEYEARHDALTGLPNRRAFMNILKDTLARTGRNRQGTALLFMDLDGFKQLNDEYGHEFGDRVLQSFAAVIRASVRVTDCVARLAGDEFTVILENLENPETDAKAVAQKLLDKLKKEHAIGDIQVRLSASIGIAIYSPTQAEDPKKLLAKADKAMYLAKNMGKRQFVLLGGNVSSSDDGCGSDGEADDESG